VDLDDGAGIVTTCIDTCASPVGELTLVSDGTNLTGLYLPGHRHRPQAVAGARRDAGPFRALRDQLDAYFAGEPVGFDVPLAPHGTPFQRSVWAALRAIPYGATATYGQIAAAIGNPKAVRAVGLANGRNPISIVIPCHRVIGADGSLTGYGGGVQCKRALLDLEAGVLPIPR
jgi:methylated-DNA-[protein]-cysteine S-methyltransferase